ncbi:MAG: T9SS type A sorting domain-containing protein [Candidatus Electryonea clarkiae]|nr:T9SS type A sorting domain-containing protein [Candidatus Electryonea clarkiae]MDP8288285.1 T9SS type A sorting domain-containing protein [Candidatus Electryonea clarkiae]
MILKALKPLLALFLLPVILLAQDGINISLVSQHYDFWENASEIEIAGNYAYVASGSSGLRVLDLSSPASPEEIGSLEFDHPVHDVEIYNDYAFLACGYPGVVIVDISDPDSPIAIDTLSETDTLSIHCTILELTRSYLYVFTDDGENGDGLVIYDVNEPSDPEVLAYRGDIPNPEFITINEPNIYLVCGSSYTYVYDISNPANPSYVTHIMPAPTGSNQAHTAAAATGDYVYILGWNYPSQEHSWMRVWDISNPEEPDSIALLLTVGLDDIQIHGDYAFATGGFRRDIPRVLKVLELSNPANPHYIGYYDTPGKASNFAVSDSLLYLNDGYAGLSIYNISDQRNLHLESSFERIGNIKGMWRDDDELFVHDESRGILFLDIEVPTSPTDTDPYQLFGGFNEIVRESDLLLATGHILDPYTGGQLMIFDMSDPEEITYESSYDLDRLDCELAAKDQYAYVAQPLHHYNFQLLVLDLEEPSTPRLINTLTFDHDGLSTIMTDGDLLYLLGNTSIEILDISDAGEPESLSRLEISPNVNLVDGYVRGENLYLLYTLGVSDDAGIRVIDLSNLGRPVQTKNYIFDNLHWAVDCSGDGDQMVVLDAEEGFTVFDISNPDDLQEIGHHPMTHYPWRIEMIDGHILLPSRTQLDIFRVEEANAPESTTITPAYFNLEQNYPNPFNSTTTISFFLPDQGAVNLNVYDVSGRLVKILTKGMLQNGSHRIIWDGMDSHARSVASGTYLYRVDYSDKSAAGKMILLK